MSHQQEPDLLDHPRYKKHSTLGRGSFGVVVLAEDRQTGRPVAIKLLYRGPQVTRYTEREAFTHAMIAHPHVVKLKRVFLTRQCLGIVLEYANLGDLFRYVTSRTRLTEDQARWFFQQLMVAVDYLHKMGIAHRDIKLENILLAGTQLQPIVKLCDFGYAKDLNHHSVANSTVGTPTYMAPEVVLQREYDGKIADIWSCGVVLYVMLLGRYPFEMPEDARETLLRRQQLLLSRLLSTEVTIPRDAGLSPGCIDLLSRMLTRAPDQRIAIAEVFAHPWFQRNLPPGVLEMNSMVYKPSDPQDPEEVKAILEAAHYVTDEVNDAALLDDYAAGHAGTAAAAAGGGGGGASAAPAAAAAAAGQHT